MTKIRKTIDGIEYDCTPVIKREPIIIEKTMKFEVYPYDAPKLMTWVKADKWVKSLGEGWRLPTREELLFMFEKRHDIGGLKTEYSSDGAHWYWSCTEHP